MVRPRYPQRSLAEMWFRDSVDDCWEPWMRQADELLDDPQFVECRRHSHGAGRRAAGGAARALPPRSSCGCWCGSTSTTGATLRCSGS